MLSEIKEHNTNKKDEVGEREKIEEVNV